MTDIVLATINAKYIHAAFGLRYLMANLPDGLRERAAILELNLSQRPIDMLSKILAMQPKIVGLGVYIWNTVPSTELVALLKRVRPDIKVVLGGPEVSHEWEKQDIVALADHIVTGEGEVAFAKLCGHLLDEQADGEQPKKVLYGGTPPIEQIALPYGLYTDEDLAHRVVYVEASRGCPFRCEFCLSSLDKGVRKFALEPFLAQMQGLFDRGLRQFKFVDRTFNLSVETSKAILEFFLKRYEPGLFVHFEMVPDRLPEALREVITQFPAGALQFEVGIQTFDVDVAARISRRQDYDKLEDNLKFLKERTGVHVHADLIAGLPGETWESFGRGFDRLIKMGPQEIQVGILKRLRGTPIVRHDQEWAMCYSPLPPYELLQNRTLNFDQMRRLRAFSRRWDQLGNSGQFTKTLALLLGDGSAFNAMMGLSDWLEERGGGEAISLTRWVDLLFGYLTDVCKIGGVHVALTLLEDYWRGGRRDDIPKSLGLVLVGVDLPARPSRRMKAAASGLPARQARHWTDHEATTEQSA